jgi:hypothetical protein
MKEDLSARKINGLRQRLEAAMLLLRICPKCGTELSPSHLYADDGEWQLHCDTDGYVCTRTREELRRQLDIGYPLDYGMDA